MNTIGRIAFAAVKETTMSFETQPLHLRHETRELLERLRHAAVPLAVYGAEPAEADAVVRAITDPMFEGAALPATRILQFGWYVRELTRLLRTRTGGALVFQLEYLLRRWAAYGMEANSLQFVLAEVVTGLEQSQPAATPAGGGS